MYETESDLTESKSQVIRICTKISRAVQRYRMRGLNSLAITPSLQLLSLFLVGLSSLLTRWI